MYPMKFPLYIKSDLLDDDFRVGNSEIYTGEVVIPSGYRYSLAFSYPLKIYNTNQLLSFKNLRTGRPTTGFAYVTSVGWC